MPPQQTYLVTASWWHWDLSASVRQSKPSAVCVKALEMLFVVQCSIAFLWAQMGLVVGGFYCVAECKISSYTDIQSDGRAHTKRKYRTCGQRDLHNTVASSLSMHNAWEHVNTLFRACINDHGETRSLSTKAINKRWRTDKGPYLPRLQNLHPTLPHHLIHWDTFHANS